MKLNKILAAVAILAAGAANASIDLMSGATSITPGNSSLILVKEDSTGINKAGLTVDLGYNLSDFVGSGALTAANTTVVWDFAANTITTNGALVSGSVTRPSPSGPCWPVRWLAPLLASSSLQAHPTQLN